jgi:membrane protease YdiL (CAAX protease family)
VKTTDSFIARHAVPIYYVITFTISYGGVLLAVGGPRGILGTPERFETLLPLVIMALLAGPYTAGVLMTGLVHGRAGLREFLSRLLRWRVGGRWYATALLGAPLVAMTIFLALSLVSGAFLPGILAADDKASWLVTGLATGVAAGLEELGWTGFAIPGLRRRHGVLATGLIAGILWAVWHVPVALWLGFSSGTIQGTLSLVSYLADPFLFLVGFRVLMVYVYDRTGSLFVSILMHLSLTASARIITPAGIAGWPLLTFGLVWAVVMWAAVAAVVGRDRDSLARRPTDADAGE